MNLIKTLCCLKTEKLEEFLYQFLIEEDYKNVSYKKGNYIFAEGELPVCLIAHIDTVFALPPKKEDFLYDPEKNILWSPYGSGFDDRAGVALILNLISLGYRPSIIFTNEEEVGGVGALNLIHDYPKCPFKKCNALIEVDRMGEKDCVFYECNNKKFKEYIKTFGFEEAEGTFSDISFIAPEWGIAAVNLSAGYLDEHSYAERLNFAWHCDILIKLYKILDDIGNQEFFKFIYKKATVKKCYFCGVPLRKKYYIITETNNLKLDCCSTCYQEIYNKKSS